MSQTSQQMDNPFEVVARYANQAPVPIERIITDLGIEYREVLLPDQDSGLIERADGKYRIIVNSFHALVRKRFTAAHELGHYVYHRDLIGDGILDDAAYRSKTSGRYANSLITKDHESQANRFAANVLMPMPLIEKIKKEYGYNTQLNVPQIAKALQVSEQALKIRLGLS